MTPLHRLTALGTSVWIDGLVPPAELDRLVHEDAVTGLTSNPTIFRAAVLGSDRYASRIAALAGRPPLEVYEALAVKDVQAAPRTALQRHQVRRRARGAGRRQHDAARDASRRARARRPAQPAQR